MTLKRARTIPRRQGQRPTPEEREQAKNKFLDAFGVIGLVTTAADQAGVSTESLYNWRQIDAEFAAAWKKAEERALDRLESEAWRRAVQGTEQTVYQQGQAIGTKREYSDRLLEFLLVGRNPEKFGARVQIKHQHEMLRTEATRLAERYQLDPNELLHEAEQLVVESTGRLVS